MVYNALKLFMEINPDLFDEAMQQYKQRKIRLVRRISETSRTFPECLRIAENVSTC
jgi:hypothetical protein